MKQVLLALALICGFFLPETAFAGPELQKPAPADDKAAVADVIPLTMGNLRGHKMLYNEGWFVVTSSSRALDFARERSLVSSKAAIEQALVAAGKDTAAFRQAVKADVIDSAALGRDIVIEGTRQTGELLADTHDLGKRELAYSRESFRKAMGYFIQGNLSIAGRTEEERRELASLPGDYFRAIRNDFSNIYELTESARKRFAQRIDPAWEKAFEKASREFRSEYEKSGTKRNSLLALGPILSGYLKSFYYGLAAPASKTIVSAGAAGTSYAVFLPVTATAVVTGRTVQSLGLTLYYAGKSGVKIISPTVEGGLLCGLSLLSLGSVPVTYAAGGTWGAMNQVAFTAAGPAAAVVEATATTTVHTVGYVGFLAYDAVKGATKIVINQAASGVVLGYNALTAIPTHALLGVTDAAIFLAWDGPRLVIAAARGGIRSGKDAAAEDHSLGELPVGTVVDLKKLEGAEGVTVDIISTDAAVIKEVLERIPDDARSYHDKAH